MSPIHRPHHKAIASPFDVSSTFQNKLMMLIMQYQEKGWNWPSNGADPPWTWQFMDDCRKQIVRTTLPHIPNNLALGYNSTFFSQISSSEHKFSESDPQKILYVEELFWEAY